MADQYLLDLKLNFIEEIRSKLLIVENNVIALESNTNKTIEERLNRDNFSIIHSIKGSAQAFQFDIISTLCHIFEDHMILNQTANILAKDKYNIFFSILDIVREYSDQYLNEKETIDNHKFKNRYNHILCLKSKKEEQILLNDPSIRILMVNVPGTVLKQSNHALKDLKNISFASVCTVIDAIDRISKEKFDVIVSSYQMEPLNGLSLCAAVRTQYGLKAPFFILNPSDNVNIEALHVDVKPNTVILRNEEFGSKLKNQIKELQSNKINYTNDGKSKLFFIDDNEDILELYKDLCKENDKIVPMFHNGTDFSLDQVEKFAPSLIICDICIPGIDTKELFLSIKNSQRLSSVPVVFITGNSQQPICEDLLKLGATAILEKTSIAMDFFKVLESIKIVL